MVTTSSTARSPDHEMTGSVYTAPWSTSLLYSASSRIPLRSSSISTSAADRSTLPTFSTVISYATTSPGSTGSFGADDVLVTVQAAMSSVTTQSGSKSGPVGSVPAGSGQLPPVTALTSWPSPSASGSLIVTE